jgi:exopolyphosphatase / guanosine-5'-triphosphate,3'-diphosphate pyrophosphatase
MPGFSRPEQNTLALLASAQLGGLRKLRQKIDDDLTWLMVLAIRVSRIIHRSRTDDENPLPALFLKRRALRIEMPGQWAQRHPLAHSSLLEEAAAWDEAGVFESFSYQTI